MEHLGMVFRTPDPLTSKVASRQSWLRLAPGRLSIESRMGMVWVLPYGKRGFQISGEIRLHIVSILAGSFKYPWIS